MLRAEMMLKLDVILDAVFDSDFLLASELLCSLISFCDLECAICFKGSIQVNHLRRRGVFLGNRIWNGRLS